MINNCKVLQPDGTEAFYCTSQQANWLIRHGYAESRGDQLSIYLIYTLSSNTKSPLLFLSKQCMICGTTKNITGHHIIPKRIIKALKLHDNLDNIAPLCEDCHAKYEIKARLFEEEYRDKLYAMLHTLWSAHFQAKTGADLETRKENTNGRDAV